MILKPLINRLPTYEKENSAGFLSFKFLSIFYPHNIYIRFKFIFNKALFCLKNLT